MARQDHQLNLNDHRAEVQAAKARLRSLTAVPPRLPAVAPLRLLARHPVLAATAAAAAVVLGRKRALPAAMAAGRFLLRNEAVRRHAAQWILSQALVRRGRSAGPPE